MHMYTPAQYVRTPTVHYPILSLMVSCDYCPTPLVPKAPPIKVLRVGDHLDVVMGGRIVGDTAQVPFFVMKNT